MIHRTTCNNCGSLLEYDSTSTHEGLRDLEDILCPVCGKKYVWNPDVDKIICPYCHGLGKPKKTKDK